MTSCSVNNYVELAEAGLISEAGNTQLDDKDEYTVATDKIATAVTNLEYEYSENEKKFLIIFRWRIHVLPAKSYFLNSCSSIFN